MTYTDNTKVHFTPSNSCAIPVHAVPVHTAHEALDDKPVAPEICTGSCAGCQRKAE